MALNLGQLLNYVNIGEFVLRRSHGKYPSIFTSPDLNNYFRGEYQEQLLNNGLKQRATEAIVGLLTRM